MSVELTLDVMHRAIVWPYSKIQDPSNLTNDELATRGSALAQRMPKSGPSAFQRLLCRERIVQVVLD
jgi:hypothetical protein